MMNILFVGFGGFLGAILRYLVSLITTKFLRWDLPIATLIVNVTGGLLIGFFMTLFLLNETFSPSVKIFMVTGIFGGLTTFSTFSYETILLFSNGQYMIATSNILLNVSLSFGGVILGKYIASYS